MYLVGILFFPVVAAVIVMAWRIVRWWDRRPDVTEAFAVMDWRACRLARRRFALLAQTDDRGGMRETERVVCAWLRTQVAIGGPWARWRAVRGVSKWNALATDFELRPPADIEQQ